MATSRPEPEIGDLAKAESWIFSAALHRQSTRTAELMARFEKEAFQQSFVIYTSTFVLGTLSGYALYPVIRSGLDMVDPKILELDLAEIGQPMAVVITTIAVTFGDLLSTTLGFGFDRLQAIRQSYYQEAAQLGILTNDLLLVFHDLPAEREAAIRRLYRHARTIYFTTDEARNDPRNNLSYIYMPGATSPFDDPLLRLIRQMSTFSGNLRSRDSFLERILDRIDSSCRLLSARRDERLSWELSRSPSALYFSLLSLSTVFFLAYILLTSNLTWPGYQLFFAAISGALALLYLVLLDLGDVHRGAFTVNSGLRGETGTAPILKPAIDCIAFFLDEAREECRQKALPLKGPGEF